MGRPIAVADCETDPFLYGRMPKPFIWGFYDGDIYKEFHDTADFAAYIRTRKIIIYAHNGGKFDWHFLLPFLDNQAKLMLINGRLSKWKLGKAELRDSYNILPVPLKALNKDDFDYSKLEQKIRAENMPEIQKYLKSDCVYLYEAIMDFTRRYGLHLTQASAAMRQWQKMGGEPPKTSPDYFNSIQPWYFGGRVTPFKMGVYKGNFNIIDINSAYPRAMMELHPWGTDLEVLKFTRDKDLRRSFLKVTCNSHGALPVRNDDGSLNFPHRRDTYFITGHEFIAGLETKTISNIKIHYLYRWKKTMHFQDYVMHFYEMKKLAKNQGDKAGELFAKLLLNTLYGKFASDPSRYREYIIDDYGTETPKGYNDDAIVGAKQLFSRPLQSHFQRYYNVAVSASITGWVRAYLWQSLKTVENPFYCDTDSIICKSTGPLKLGDELGEWKLEGKAKRIAIAGKKLYAAQLIDGSWKCASKGVRLTPQEIVRVAHGEKVLYKSDAPTFSLKSNTKFIERNVVKRISV